MTSEEMSDCALKVIRTIREHTTDGLTMMRILNVAKQLCSNTTASQSSPSVPEHPREAS